MTLLAMSLCEYQTPATSRSRTYLNSNLVQPVIQRVGGRIDRRAMSHPTPLPRNPPNPDFKSLPARSKYPQQKPCSRVAQKYPPSPPCPPKHRGDGRSKSTAGPLGAAGPLSETQPAPFSFTRTLKELRNVETICLCRDCIVVGEGG